MFWYLILTLATLIFYILVFKRQRTWIKRNVKQICTTPITGDNLGIMFRKESFIDSIKRIYNAVPNERYVGIHQMNLPTLVIRDPDLIKQLGVKDFDNFTDRRSFINKSTEPLWSKSLFALTGDEWRDMRSTLSPAFTGLKMRAMFSLINDCAKQLISYYLNKNEQEIDLEMKDTFSRYANDVIATCAFGIEVDSLKEPENEFYLKGKETTDFSKPSRLLKIILGVISPPLSKLLNIKVFPDEICNFFTSLISDSIKIRESKDIKRPDMINLLMEARKGKLIHEEADEAKYAGFATVDESHIGKVKKTEIRELTDFDIAAQALIFFFAGFDTVSTVMSFFSYELVANPDIQEKLIKEVDATAAAYNNEITYDSLASMKYMDMVLSEVLRKWPPVATVDRECIRPYTIQPTKPGETPVPIKTGEVLWFPVVGLHYSSEHYENPERFDPERFSDENKHKINPYAYLPFGVGPRNCIGSRFALMEIKTVFFSILTKFTFVANEKSVIPLKIDKTSINPTAEGGFGYSLKRR